MRGRESRAVEMPTLWKSQHDSHKGLGKLAQHASFPHFHKPVLLVNDDRTFHVQRKPDILTYNEQPVSEFFPEAVEKLTQMAGKGLRPVSLTVVGLDSAEVCNVPAIGETNPIE